MLRRIFVDPLLTFSQRIDQRNTFRRAVTGIETNATNIVILTILPIPAGIVARRKSENRENIKRTEKTNVVRTNLKGQTSVVLYRTAAVLGQGLDHPS
jgi:hypothetical protein